MKDMSRLWNRTLIFTGMFLLLVTILSGVITSRPHLYAQEEDNWLFLPQVQVSTRPNEPNTDDTPLPRSRGTIGFWACDSPEYIGETQSCEIYTIQADGTNQTRLTNNNAYDGELDWSPDGSRMAFISDRDGQRELYVMHADGSNQTRLTTTTTIEADPDWSPDGSRITFSSGVDEHGTDSQIFVINADGTNQTRLTNERWNQKPVWSPDGSRLAFASFDGQAHIMVMNVDGTHTISMSGNLGYRWNPLIAWSPDGTRLAYESTGNEFPNAKGGMLYIVVRHADGTNPIYLTQEGGGQPVWSPDGERIAFFSDRHYNAEIYVVHADGSQEQRLTNSDGVYNFSPDWSPDGTRIAFVSTRDGNDEIYVMNADGTNQTRLTNDSLSVEYPIWSPTR